MRIENKFFQTLRFMLCLFWICGFNITSFSNVVSDTAYINNLLQRATILIDSLPEDSDSLAKIALLHSEKKKYDKGIASSRFIIATNLRIANHNALAIENYSRCLDYYKKTNDSIMLMEIYQWLGLCMAFESYYDSGRVIINKSISISKDLNQTSSEAQSYLNLARLHKSQGNLKLAINNCELALKTINDSLNKDLKWKIENFLAYVYLLSNRHKEAAQIINKNMYVYQSYLHMPVEVFRLLYYSSLLNLFLNNYEKVIDNQFIALKITNSIPNKNLDSYFKSMSYELIGRAYMKTEKYDSAKKFLMLAFYNPEYNLDSHAMGEILYNLADVYYYQQMNDSALYFFLKSTNIQAENKNPTYLCWSYLGMGKTYFQMKNYRMAEKYLLLATESDTLDENIEIVSKASEILSNIYFSRKDYEKAYKYYKIFKDASDELFNEDKIKKITQLELENEFEDREQLLKNQQEQDRIALEARIKQNKIIRNYSTGGLIMAIFLLIFIYRNFKQKQKSNSEKEILLKEIHHRVKNNLQIISSMLSLQGNYLSDQKIKDAVNESQGRVKSMALIHQMLYQHDTFSSLDIKEYIGQLVDSISTSFDMQKRKITTVIEIEQIYIDIDTAIPLGLIVNELLTNAYKYAFPDERTGKITIGLTRENKEKYKLLIQDNGIGLPEKNQSAKQSKSLGLNMVNILTRQLKGELNISVNEGTRFSIRFSEIIKQQKINH